MLRQAQHEERADILTLSLSKGEDHVSRPSPALCLYCSTSSADLDRRRKIAVRRQISGSHSRAWTQSGGWKVNSTHSADPQTRAPTMSMPNTMGPSPASNIA